MRALVDREAAGLDADDRRALTARIVERALGLGPARAAAARPGRRRDPRQRDAPGLGRARGPARARRRRAFATEAELRHAIERLLAPAGRRADEAEPVCDARLPDGSRVNVVLPPLAVDGPALTIRRFRPRGLHPDELVRSGSWTRAAARPAARGGRRAAQRPRLRRRPGSGKTTTLGALATFLGDGERVVTIEDTAELRLGGAHVVRLEARPAGLRRARRGDDPRLVRNALRMRPDRIVVGEVRGPEALDMLAAMATGHEGSLCTVHAGSPAGGAAPDRDAGADGRRRPPARGDPRAGRGRARPRDPPGARARRRRAGSPASPRS